MQLKGTYETVKFEVKDSIGFITLDDPKTKNALDIDMLDGIIECIDLANKHQEIRVVVIHGLNNAFSSGGNIKGMGQPTIRNGVEMSREDKMRLYGEAAWAVRTCKKPVIAWIEGSAAGAGFSLALACDFRFTTESAKFIFAFAKVGLMPDMGAAWTLCRMVGTALATDLFMTARTILGDEAKRLGIVNEALATSEALEAHVMEFAAQLAQGPTVSYTFIKEIINMCMMKGFDEGIEYEAVHQTMLSTTEDHKEGTKAFMEKRAPKYKGC